MALPAWMRTKKFIIISSVIVIAIVVGVTLGVVLSQSNEPTHIRFPYDFKFGAASAAYQIEGGWDADGKGASIWDVATNSDDNFIIDSSNGNVAANSYELYERDVQLLKQTGVAFYRFSISWSRILPDGDISSKNQLGIDYYNRLIDELIANDIEPMVTMYHWDLPQALQILGGWTNPMIIDYFEQYAKVLFENFGDRVKNWNTLNEPVNFCVLGYGTARHAPRIHANGIGEYLCGHHALLAHAKAYHLYKNDFFVQQNGQIGIVLYSSFAIPKDESKAEDVLASRISLEFLFGWYANPIFSETGGYPNSMISKIDANSVAEGRRWSRLPTFTEEEITYVQGTSDFMGLNYYTSQYVEPAPNLDIFENPSIYRDAGILTSFDSNWKVAASQWLRSVPDGLRGLLNWIKNEYKNPTVIITENGWSDDGSSIDDHERIHYLESHLKAIALAITEDDCNVKGHTTWSIIDNFEWTQGYTERFGIYSVDFSSASLNRVARRSVEVLRNIIESKLIVVDIVEPEEMTTIASDITTPTTATITTTTESSTEDPRYEFPSDFMFGAASAAYQIEGAWNVDGKGPSIWDVATQTDPDFIADNSNGNVAANSYELYLEDIKVLKETGVDFYRFSISWPRILPDGDISSLNEPGLIYYDKLIDALIENNIMPMVTMYHWDLPQSLQILGGWSNPIIVDYFEQYAKVLFQRYSAKVPIWVTLNEPGVFCGLGYGWGAHAPRLQMSGIADYLCGHHALLAHAKVYHMYKNNYFNTAQNGQIGIVLQSGFSWPLNFNVEDIAAAERSLQFSLGWYAHPIFSEEGNYPEVMINNIGINSENENRKWSRLPVFTAEEIALLKGSSDFMGLNYYTSSFVYNVDLSDVTETSSWKDQSTSSTIDNSWPVAASTWIRDIPKGLRDLLNWIKNQYNNPIVYITENGFSDNGSTLNDLGRIRYLNGHLLAVARAIQDDGCNVKGHTTWSIIDNFEWGQGYTEKFGIYYVNFTSPNKERIAKDSVAVLQDIIQKRSMKAIAAPTLFPKYFMFGAASAAYQIEGAWNTDGKGLSVWDVTTQNNPDRIADASTGNVAANSYEFYKRDVEMLVETKVDFYRFSISWPRILPDGDISSLNEAGIDYYNNLINELIANNITPVVTMYHWDLPQALQILGGWTNPIVIDYFEQYAKLLFERFGDRIKHWNTFNEPIIYCVYGYGTATHAPLIESNGIGEYLCAHHTLLANAKVYHMYKDEYFAEQQGLIGIVCNSGFTWPSDPNNPEDVKAADRSIQFWLGWYSHPIFSEEGNYPQIMIDIIDENSFNENRKWSRLPKFTDEEIVYVKGTSDYLGLNYYTSGYAEPSNDLSWALDPSFYRDQNIHSYIDEEWPVAESTWLRSAPQGLHDLLNWIKDQYNNPYVIITENGWSDNGESLDDIERIEYLDAHFLAILGAIDDGCNVMGHTTWSIMDNFEWMEGYTEKFGIYSVNFTSELKERTPKASVEYLQDVFTARQV